MLDALAFAALVVVPLAQVPLVAYLSRYVELDADEQLPPPGRGYVTYGTASARPGGWEEGSEGPNCGAEAAADYDYCGACAARLPPRRERR
ncbi:zinc ribbon domain-containing protein [Halobacterium yunchengense]|uniref:zinc ribbon domain-containing protein n=1 Tax=Halobacterium yunchengense TaxID=3108497 RepID=UPI00300A93B0